jgi:hypothetical protein
MLGKGEALPGAIGRLLAEHETAFLSDLGGREHASEMERGCCRRLAELELFVSLIRGRLTTVQGAPRRMPWTQERELLQLHASMVRSFVQTASALGLKRRPADLDAPEVLVKRYADPAPTGAPTDGN